MEFRIHSNYDSDIDKKFNFKGSLRHRHFVVSSDKEGHEKYDS